MRHSFDHGHRPKCPPQADQGASFYYERRCHFAWQWLQKEPPNQIESESIVETWSRIIQKLNQNHHAKLTQNYLTKDSSFKIEPESSFSFRAKSFFKVESESSFKVESEASLGNNQTHHLNLNQTHDSAFWSIENCLQSFTRDRSPSIFFKLRSCWEHKTLVRLVVASAPPSSSCFLVFAAHCEIAMALGSGSQSGKPKICTKPDTSHNSNLKRHHNSQPYGSLRVTLIFFWSQISYQCNRPSRLHWTCPSAGLGHWFFWLILK